MSNQADYLPQLTESDAVELQSGLTISNFTNSDGVLQNRTSRGLIIKPSVTQYIGFLGLQLFIAQAGTTKCRTTHLLLGCGRLLSGRFPILLMLLPNARLVKHPKFRHY